MNINDKTLPIIGAVCGDIIGSHYELRGNGTKDRGFTMFTEGSQYTDDTVCTMAVADAIYNHKDFVKTLCEWCLRHPDAGYGNMFRRWFQSDNPQPYNSNRNGAAMRVSAAGSLADSIGCAIEYATEAVSGSHNHPDAIKGASVAAVAVYLACNGESKETIKDYIESHFGYDLSRRYDDIQPSYEFDVTCEGSVPESIICFLESDSYEDAVRRAVAMGGDSDTMAAIAGSIAAPYYGSVPEEIMAECEKRLPADMLNLIGNISD